MVRYKTCYVAISMNDVVKSWILGYRAAIILSDYKSIF